MTNLTAPATSSVAQNLPATTLEQLRALVDELRAEFPAAGQRLDHAATLVLSYTVERGTAPGLWWVDSETEPGQQYLVLRKAGEPSSCTCQDWSRRGAQAGVCKHIAATVLIERGERAEAEATDPTPEPPPAGGCGIPHLVDVDISGLPIPFVLTPEAQGLVDERRQRQAARCPECGDYKQHGDLWCGANCCARALSRRLAVIA